MSGLKGDLASAMKSVAGDWKKSKLRSAKNNYVSSRDIERMMKRTSRQSIKDAAFEVMEKAYMKASANNSLPANARQVYYAARRDILNMTSTEKLDSQYFTQTLLKQYQEERSPDWDVVYDARGHFKEPHTKHRLGLGSLEVRDYIKRFTKGAFSETPLSLPELGISTTGPVLRYGGVLFVEKEGFDPLLEAAKIAERYDLAIASTKGMPVSAMCDLLYELKRYGLKVYVLHDFDKSGFSIVSTLREGTRGSRGTGEIVDLGFRLEDIVGLEREAVSYKQRENPRCNLSQNGATDEEIGILVQGGGYHDSWHGERVELNAMTSEQLITWLERKLEEHGISKVVPDDDVLAAAYRRALFQNVVKKHTEELKTSRDWGAQIVPDDLADKLKEMIRDNPEMSWDNVVSELAYENAVEELGEK